MTTSRCPHCRCKKLHREPPSLAVNGRLALCHRRQPLRRSGRLGVNIIDQREVPEDAAGSSSRPQQPAQFGYMDLAGTAAVSGGHRPAQRIESEASPVESDVYVWTRQGETRRQGSRRARCALDLTAYPSRPRQGAMFRDERQRQRAVLVSNTLDRSRGVAASPGGRREWRAHPTRPSVQDVCSRRRCRIRAG